MAKGRNRIIVVALVVFVIIFGVYTFSGNVLTRDINGMADVSMSHTLSGHVMEDETIQATGIDWAGNVVVYDLSMLIKMNLVYQTLPDNLRVNLIVSGVAVQTKLMDDFVYYSNIGTYGVNWDMNLIPQGSHVSYFVFSGDFGADRDGPLILVGESIRFVIQNIAVGVPDPLEISNLPIDITMEAYETENIVWSYKYDGVLTVEVTDDQQRIATANLLVSLVVTDYVLSYYAQYSGDHEIRITFTPADGTDNIAQSDTMIIHVNVGGDIRLRAPSVDRIDIQVSAIDYETGQRMTFDWEMFTEAPVVGLSQTYVSGIITIQCDVSPISSLILMRAVVSEVGGDISYPMIKVSVGWTIDIDTDVLTAGPHTITIYGTDVADGHEYMLGTFGFPVRSGETDMTLIYLGVGVIGVVIVIIVISRRKK